MMLKKNLLKVAEQYISFEGSNSSVLLKSLKTNYLRDNCKINVRLTVEVDGKRTYDKKLLWALHKTLFENSAVFRRQT